uniref:F-box domain-containing protein n=2 Tax=Caenorhabditis tropicalis TaxID=1561998 RepID=A0A1I7UU24_9PELO
MTTFPLLQLPLVAMEHVLCMMSPFELIDVSLASSRAKRCVKNFTRTQQIISTSFDNSHHSITFQIKRMSWRYAIKMNESHASRYKCVNQLARIHFKTDTELIIKVSEKPLKEIIKWFDYAREVLNCKIDDVSLDLGYPSSENRETIDWIAAQNKTMNNMEILNDLGESYDHLNEDLKYIMKRIHVSGRFNLEIEKYKDDFRMEIPGKPAYLCILNAQFIDYEQLLKLKSPVIILQNSILTSQEINQFLRSWISCETHFELEAIEISVSDPDAMIEIIDLPHEKTNDPKIVKAFGGYPHYHQVKNEIFTIKRSDGKKRASVNIDRLWYGRSLFLIVH